MTKVSLLLILCVGVTFVEGCSKFEISGRTMNKYMVGEYVEVSNIQWYGRPIYEHRGKKFNYYMYYRPTYAGNKRPEWVIREASEFHYIQSRSLDEDRETDEAYAYYHVIARSLDSAVDPTKIKAPWEEKSKKGRWMKIPSWKIECQDKDTFVRRSWLLAGLILIVGVFIIVLLTCGLRLYIKTRKIQKQQKNGSTAVNTDSPPPYWISCQAAALPEKVNVDVTGYDNPAAGEVPHSPPGVPPRYDEINRNN